MQPTPGFLSGESHAQRSLAGYSPWGRIESDMTEACMHMKYTIGQSYEKICNKRLVDCVPWLPRWHSGKESAYNAGDSGLIPGLGRFPERGNGNPLQYSCLENPMDRGVWGGYSPWDCKELDMTEATEHACRLITVSRVSGLTTWVLGEHDSSLFNGPWSGVPLNIVFRS